MGFPFGFSFALLFCLESEHFEALTGEEDSALLAVVDFFAFFLADDGELALFVGMVFAFEMIEGGDVAEGGVVLLALEGSVEDGGGEVGFGFAISLYGFPSLNHC